MRVPRIGVVAALLCLVALSGAAQATPCTSCSAPTLAAVCSGGNVTLTASSIWSDANYYWFLDNGGVCATGPYLGTGSQLIVTPASTTKYYCYYCSASAPPTPFACSPCNSITVSPAPAVTTPLIIPQPQQITWYTSRNFHVNAQTQIVMPTNPDDKDNLTAAQLQQRVWNMTGYLPPIVLGTAGAPTSNVIAIGQSARNTAAAAIIASWPDAAGKSARSEGYLLGVKNSSVVIQGFDQKGTFYGCQTYDQLLEQFGSSPMTGFFCYDYPDRPWRGMMVRVRSKFDIAWSEQIMSELLARFKYNIVQFDIQYATIWDSHPELYLGDPAIASHMTEIQEVADFAKKYFLEVIPAGVGFTHSSEFVTADTLYPLLRENRAAPDPAPGLETLCPRNPQAQQIVNDLRTEQINHFHPAHMHLQWDEIADIGHSSCPYCHGVAPTTLFQEFLTNDWNWMNARGIVPVMWADMLTPEMNGTINGWNLYQVASTMPKAIILEDWEYLKSQTYTRLQTWINNGLSSVGSPFGGYDPPGIANIWWWGHSVKLYNTLGLVAFNKYEFGYKSDLLPNPPTPYKNSQVQNLALYPFVAEWSWSPDARPYVCAPYDGSDVIKRAVGPDTVTGFTAVPAGQNVNLSWTNPGNSIYQATWICYRTDRAPTSPPDGTFVADVAGSPAAAGGFTHTGQTDCDPRYYAAFAHDNVRHFSAPAMAVVPGCPPPAGDFDQDGDVDMTDFGKFQACISGTAFPILSGCQFADVNGDGSVDQADYQMLQKCLAGSDIIPAANCGS